MEATSRVATPCSVAMPTVAMPTVLSTSSNAEAKGIGATVSAAGVWQGPSPMCHV